MSSKARFRASMLGVSKRHYSKLFSLLLGLILVIGAVQTFDGFVADAEGGKTLAAKTTYNFTFELPSGWEFISLPLHNNTLSSAEELAKAIPCEYVMEYNISTQTYVRHVRGSASNNFSLADGKGYFVWLTEKTSFTYEGEAIPGVEVDLNAGYNALGWYENTTTLAEEFAQNLTNCSAVAYWNNTLGRFIVHPKGTSISNFEIKPGMGLLTHQTSTGRWDTLPTIESIAHDATSALGPYDTIHVTLKGDKGYEARFDLGEVVTGVALIENSSAPGTYEGEYTVMTGDPSGTYNLTGYLSSSKYTDMMNASVQVTIDTTPPVISDVQAGAINDTCATINWTTNEASNSIVDYGTSSGSYPNSTWNETAVTSHQINLTGLTPGTKYYYVVKSQDLAGNQAISAEYNFTTTGQTFTLLLVDDDDGATYETNFQNALDANNYNYDYWNVKDSGSPSATTLSNYDIVIWFTSDDYNDAQPTPGTLGADDRAALQTYLSSGGKLFITGQDIGYDANRDGWLGWYQTNLHANYLADDSNIANLDGIAGDPIGDGFTNIPVAGTLQDEISVYGSYSTEIFLYSGSTKVAGIKADNGTSRVVNIACMYFEGTDTAANKTTIMHRILDWLNSPPDLEPPTFAGIQYANDTVWTGTLNLSWNPASDPSTPITYNIYLATSSGAQDFSTPNYTTQNTKYKVSGLTNGITYYFVVRAEDKFGNEDNNTVEKSSTPTGTETPIRRYAVVVGISYYKAISNLSYCDEDAADWYYFLTGSKKSSTVTESDYLYALEPFDQVWVYGDTEKANYPKYDGIATEYNVKQALQNMISLASSTDILVFTTSGHGSGDGAGSSYLCMWDSGSGESGEDGNLYDTELAAIFANSPAKHNFIFIDHCYSGGMGPELLTNANGNTIYCTTTCTENGYGYDDGPSYNGLYTNWFLNKGLRNGESGNGGNQNMEANFDWVSANYPYQPPSGDAPMEFDGDTSNLFYL